MVRRQSFTIRRVLDSLSVGVWGNDTAAEVIKV